MCKSRHVPIIQKQARPHYPTLSHEIKGKTLGVIGLGAIGVMVANLATALGMNVIGYDPYISVDAAWNLSRAVKKSADIKAMAAKCDYITMHLPLLDSTVPFSN